MAWFDQAQPQTFHTPTETPEETGFWDNANAGYEAAKREDLPIFSPAQSNQAMEYRKSVIDKLVKSGDVTSEELEFYDNNSGYDLDGLSHYLRNDRGFAEVMSPHEYDVARNAEYSDLRAKEAMVHEGQSKMGFVGEMAGSMASMVHDPIYMGGVVLGYGVAGTILESTVMATAATSAGIEMATEGLATPTKMSFKKELGLEYGASEAVVNILAAGAFGGVLSGAGKYVSNQFAKLSPENMTVAEATERLVSFAGEGRTSELAPILNVLSKADPNESALTVLARDESISATQNNRGAKKGADPRAESSNGYAHEAELKYETMKANAEKAVADAEAPADKGGTQVPPSYEAQKAVFTDRKTSLASYEEARKILNKGKPRPHGFDKETKAQAKVREKYDEAVRVVADSEKADPFRTMGATKGFMAKLDKLSEDILDMSEGKYVPQTKEELNEILDNLRQLPASSRFMKKLDDFSRDIDALESGTYVPKTAEQTAKDFASVRKMLTDEGVLEGGTQVHPSEKAPVKVYAEDAHPLVKAKYDEVADLDARLAKMEEVC